MQVKGDMKLIQGDLLYTDEAGSKEYGIRQITKKVLAAEQAVADVSAGKKMIDHLSVGTTNDGTKSKLIVKGNIEMLDGDMKYKSDDGQTEYSLKEVSKLAMEGGGTGFDEVKKGVKAITDGTKVFTKMVWVICVTLTRQNAS